MSDTDTTQFTEEQLVTMAKKAHQKGWLSQHVISGATLEDAQKIATPVYASFEKWRDHGADDSEPHAEFTGILLSIGFSEDTICG